MTLLEARDICGAATGRNGDETCILSRGETSNSEQEDS
jgi:hypothetical protein